MLFKSFYRYLYTFAVMAAFLDYAITNVGITKYPIWFEANPFKRIMFRYMNPHLASTIVFMVTFLFVFGSYWLLREHLNQTPYNSTMKTVGQYLWNLSDIKIRDLTIFACLALILLFTTQHIIGTLSWTTALL